MPDALDRLTIKGFKSVKSLDDFELRCLNVLIGGNGAGKSNFVDFFHLLRAMMAGNLAVHVMGHGGCDDFLFNGPETTSRIEIALAFDGQLKYACSLLPSTDERFIFEKERFPAHEMFGGFETHLIEIKADKSFPDWETCERLHHLISDLGIYHFDETGAAAPMRRSEILQDNERLRFNAANIAPFLLKLRIHEENSYHQIIDTIRLMAPFFNDFILRPNGDKEKVNLAWNQRGSNYPLQPYHFSDGTIRFICLATALLQPLPPSTVIIDEPELGLHPYAIEILAELIRAASKKTQVIVSTQSPALVDCFEPEDVIVVNRKAGASQFERLDEKDLSAWLEDYSLGDLWRKNIVTAGPSHE